MKIVRDYQFVSEAERGAVVAIGNFDGIHLGHQAVLDIARAEAQRLSAPLGVMTFEPHPRQFFAPDAPPFRLTNAAARAHRLEKLGVDVLYELSFTSALAALSPEEFAKGVLSDGLGARHVVVGADFHFGAKRAGKVEDLQKYGESEGFGTSVAQLLERKGLEVSSTAIRKALSDGLPRDAAAMLGHWHRIEGTVIRGDQRGRDLGFPTANMALTDLHRPRFGVYAVLVDVLTGPHAGSYHGAASLGLRPTFGGQEPNLETYLFDFRGDLYGSQISVGLVDFLRPEEKFTDINALIEQMDRDCLQARDILGTL
ncbi:riboflavin kinase / FMN adenylyltransferase [Pseudooceanicola antarcticus]|uniref:Riboflavin biosynthesis protein n=1 Tax=Pseudooceanicola antarcticus TaxID=1247613 RepID=A0A285IL70_9RHOB|nr:bifunctional riboflavin kinase/FAD synthetase [Pseudooceanicola antarcticus]PJE28619.1 bifunctional riboflavin kinase/FAD synthetase [Pseudooceanicola antarcticus]SNY48750.1 riboflavin kinase / FMN adenylyltransferase [Pseudooceanicola antarcticus]